MRNIELKARCNDLKRAEAVTESLGARRVWVRRQTDIYFRVAHGRLKLRLEEPGGAVLVAYHRADTPSARESRYEITPIQEGTGSFSALGEGACPPVAGIRGQAPRSKPNGEPVPGDAQATLAALEARHGIAARVEKTRTLYLIANVRIHLDEVAGLGTFIEFEAVLGEGDSEAEARALLGRLAAAFGIEPGEILAGSYADMVAGSGR